MSHGPQSHDSQSHGSGEATSQGAHASAAPASAQADLETAIGPEFRTLIDMAARRSSTALDTASAQAKQTIGDAERLATLRQTIAADQARAQNLEQEHHALLAGLKDSRRNEQQLAASLETNRRDLIRSLISIAGEGLIELPPKVAPLALRREQLKLLGVDAEAAAVFIARHPERIFALCLPERGEPVRWVQSYVQSNVLKDGWAFLESLADILRPKREAHYQNYPPYLEELYSHAGWGEGRHVLDDFCSALDPEIRNELAAPGEPRILEYNFCAQAEGRARIYRAQALGALPFFAEAIMAESLQKNITREEQREKGLDKPCQDVPGLAARIDQGESPQELLAEFYGCSKSLIRRLAQGKPPPAARGDPRAHITNQDFLKGLQQIDINLIPAFEEGAKDSAGMLEFLRFAMALERTHGANMRCGEVLSELPTKWQALLKQNERVRIGDAARAVGELRDFLRAFFEAAVAPELGEAGASARENIFHICAPEIFRTIFPTPNPLKVLDTVQEWHEVTWRWPKRIRDISWPELTLPVSAPPEHGGCRMKFLTSEAEIVFEGAQQEHCVGGYADRCLTGQTHILSVRDQQGNILSTAEFQRDNDNSIRLAQHRAKRNGQPAERAAQSVAWLQERISSGEIQIDFQQLDQRLKDLRNKQGESQRNEALEEANFARFKRWLPKIYKDITRREFLFATGAFAIIKGAPASSHWGSTQHHGPDSPVYRALNAVANLFRRTSPALR